MHVEHVAARTIEPRDQDEILADADVAQSLDCFGLEYEPRFRRAFVGLSRAASSVRRFDETLPIGLRSNVLMLSSLRRL
jgi:hypothetical protein